LTSHFHKGRSVISGVICAGIEESGNQVGGCEATKVCYQTLTVWLRSKSLPVGGGWELIPTSLQDLVWEWLLMKIW